MNDSLVDFWSIFHLLLPMVKTILLLHYSRISLLSIILIVIIYEFFEYLFIGELLFQWNISGNRESLKNMVMDIIIGVIGVIIGYMIFINL